MSEDVNICMIQDQFLVGDIKGNTRKIISLAQQMQSKGADLLLFPELALSGYPPEDLLLRRGFIRQLEAAIEEIAAASGEAQILFGAPRRAADGTLYNAAL